MADYVTLTATTDGATATACIRAGRENNRRDVNERDVGEGVVRDGIDRSHIFITTMLGPGEDDYQRALGAFDATSRRPGLEGRGNRPMEWEMTAGQ